MKKLFALSLAMLFLGVGIASATDVSVSGSYYVRGTHKENIGGTLTDQEGFGDYDHELSVDVNWKIDDMSSVFARFEMRDETMGVDSNPTEGTKLDSADADTQLDDNIIVEQVYGKHTFGNGLEFQGGLMSANAWATDFADEGGEDYRFRFIQPTTFGNLIGIIQKDKETSSTDTDDDQYIVALVSKVGDVNVKPLLKYVDMESGKMDVFAAVLGLDGAMGNIGWEAEAVYSDYDREANEDFELYGVYGNVWAQINAAKIGALVAYGSYDDDTDNGFQFGDNFAAGGALLLGDDVFMDVGTVLGDGDDLQAVTLFAVYGDYAVNDKLTLKAYFGYAASNVDEDDATDRWDGASAWELSGGASYKITPNVTYSVAAGTAQVEFGNNEADPDAAIEIQHKLSFSF